MRAVFCADDSGAPLSVWVASGSNGTVSVQLSLPFDPAGRRGGPGRDPPCSSLFAGDVRVRASQLLRRDGPGGHARAECSARAA